MPLAQQRVQDNEEIEIDAAKVGHEQSLLRCEIRTGRAATIIHVMNMAIQSIDLKDCRPSAKSARRT
jgi:hypothetical protein